MKFPIDLAMNLQNSLLHFFYTFIDRFLSLGQQLRKFHDKGVQFPQDSFSTQTRPPILLYTNNIHDKIIHFWFTN